MTIQLTLLAPLEERLRQEAERQGVSADAVTLRLLEEHLPRPGRAAELTTMFKQWEEEQAAQDDPNYDFFAALDAARTSNRKLFPAELKGISW
jgi:hypothetical protein